MSADRQVLGARLREAREAPPYWSREELARRLRAAADPRELEGLAHVQSLARRIKAWERGDAVPALKYRRLYARVLEVTEDDLFGLAESAEPAGRRDVLKWGAAVIAPDVLHRLLRDTAAEAMEFTRQASATTVGAGTFAHLESVITALDRAYSRDTPLDLFMTARTYRFRVAEMIQGPRTLKEARELYVYAAWLSELLAWLAHDLGDPLSAEAWAIDSFEHADQAGHDELCAWATDAMASIAIYADRPGRAVTAAHQGIAKAPTHHPLAVRLRAQAARAHARLGEREACEVLLQDAGVLYERLPARPPTRFAVETGHLATFAMTSYPASAYIWLGDDDRGDFEKARMHALEAIATYESLPAAARSPSREAIARIDLGIALAALGQPEEAADLGHQALASPRLVDSVHARAGDLEQALTARHPGLGVVADFSDAYRAAEPNAR